jgi:hypothetical protein
MFLNNIRMSLREYKTCCSLTPANHSLVNIHCEQFKKSSMVMKALSLLILVFLSDRINCEEGYFTVVGSHLIKQGKPYEGAINYHNYVNEKTLQISIKSKTRDSGDEKEEEITAKNVSFAGTGSQNFKLDVR